MSALAMAALGVPAAAALVLLVALLRCARGGRTTLGQLLWTLFGRVDGQ